MADVFALQDQVALSVAGVIELAVKGAAIRRVQARPTEYSNSHDLYFHATSICGT